MQNSPAEVVRQLLIDLRVAITAGDWAAYAYAEPDRPDNCITVRDTVGRDFGRTFDGDVLYHHGFQVRVRATDDRTGWLKADAVREALKSVRNATVKIGFNAYFVCNIIGISNVLPLGKDSGTRRSVFTLNGKLVPEQR